MLYHVLYINNLEIHVRQPKFNFIVTTLKIWIIFNDCGTTNQINAIAMNLSNNIFFGCKKITYFGMEKVEIFIKVILICIFRAHVKNASNSNYTLNKIIIVYFEMKTTQFPMQNCDL
jgi:hypothetical protein